MNIQPYLDKMQAKYDKVEAELRDKKADFDIASQKQVEELQDKLKELKSKMDELKDASEDKMVDLKSHADKLADDIEANWQRLVDKFKS